MDRAWGLRAAIGPRPGALILPTAIPSLSRAAKYKMTGLVRRSPGRRWCGYRTAPEPGPRWRSPAWRGPTAWPDWCVPVVLRRCHNDHRRVGVGQCDRLPDVVDPRCHTHADLRACGGCGRSGDERQERDERCQQRTDHWSDPPAGRRHQESPVGRYRATAKGTGAVANSRVFATRLGEGSPPPSWPHGALVGAA